MTETAILDRIAAAKAAGGKGEKIDWIGLESVQRNTFYLLKDGVIDERRALALLSDALGVYTGRGSGEYAESR